MTQQHPITPSPELVEQWMQVHTTKYDLARQAAQWGADQELDACCEWIPKATPWDAEQLRAARRPKPPSLKEQSLALLDLIQGGKKPWQLEDLDVVRRALEQLPDHDRIHAQAEEARAYLASESDGSAYPTDKELLELMPETMRDEFSYAAQVCSDATGGQAKPGIFRVALNTAALEYAQAILARYAP